MKRKIANVLCLVLSLATISSLMGGCKGKNSNTTNPSNGAPVEIHIMNRVNAQVSFDNNAWVDAVDKAANVKLVIDAPPINNYADRLQIVMASGNIPDVVYDSFCGDATYQKWAADGLLADITGKIKNYPNLMKNISTDMWNVVKTSNGKINSVPKANVVNDWGYVINQNWLDKLGLKAPTTLDEFETVCKAFATQDPDGDGKADTYGVSSAGTTPYDIEFLMSAFNLTSYDGAKDVDGKYKVRERFEGYIPYLTYLRKLYAENALDKEFFTNKTYADRDKLLQNRVGIYATHQTGAFSMIDLDSSAYKRLSYHAPIKNDKGQATCYITVPIWGSWMISKNCKNVDAVLKFLDWGNSKEGFTLMNIGVKGVDYNSYDFTTKAIDRTTDQAKKLATEASSYTAAAYALDGQPALIGNCDTTEKLKIYNDQYNAMKKVVKEVNLPAISAVNCPKLVNFSTTNPDDVKTRDTNVIKYITGEITLDQFKTYLNSTYLPKIADAEKEYVNYMSSLK